MVSETLVVLDGADASVSAGQAANPILSFIKRRWTNMKSSKISDRVSGRPLVTASERMTPG